MASKDWGDYSLGATGQAANKIAEFTIKAVARLVLKESEGRL